MSVMNQKEAVFSALCAVMSCKSFEGKCEPTPEQHKQVNNILFTSFQEGKISFDGELPEDKKLKSYVSGLTSNWLRKDGRLNGGVKYQPTNPGSRAGSTDPQVKAMRALLSTVTNPKDKLEIQGHIDARIAQIKPSKSVEIDVSALPEALRHMATATDSEE